MKRLFVCLFVSLAACVATGCSGKKNEADKATPTDPPGAKDMAKPPPPPPPPPPPGG